MKLILSAVFVAALGLPGCLINNPGDLDGTWMSYAPVQCMGNPWEQDWLESHDNKYEDYPADLSTPGIESDEMAVISDYYRRQGVNVLSISSIEWDGAVCLACSCPQGYTLQLLVPDAHLDRMLDMGFFLEGAGD